MIELAVLLKDLEHCKNCNNSLQLLNIVNETRMGLGSLFHVKCQTCSLVNIVASGKRHGCAVDAGGDSSSLGRANIFDVNTKLAAGMFVV